MYFAESDVIADAQVINPNDSPDHLWLFSGGFQRCLLFYPPNAQLPHNLYLQGFKQILIQTAVRRPFPWGWRRRTLFFQGCQPIPHTSLMCKYRQRCQIPFSFSKQEIGDTTPPPPLPSTFLHQFLPSSNTKVCFWPCSRIDLGACNLR